MTKCYCPQTCYSWAPDQWWGHPEVESFATQKEAESCLAEITARRGDEIKAIRIIEGRTGATHVWRDNHSVRRGGRYPFAKIK